MLHSETLYQGEGVLERGKEGGKEAGREGEREREKEKMKRKLTESKLRAMGYKACESSKKGRQNVSYSKSLLSSCSANSHHFQVL